MDIYLKKKKLMTLGLERHGLKISIVNQINVTSRQCVQETAYAVKVTTAPGRLKDSFRYLFRLW